MEGRDVGELTVVARESVRAVNSWVRSVVWLHLRPDRNCCYSCSPR